MFYWLAFEQLFPVFTPFRVFQYSTFRTAMASITALVLSLLIGPWMIRRLQHFQIGQHIREEGPQSHQKKAGTPTMGGLLIITAILIPTLLWANLATPAVWVAILSVLLFGFIGFWDDFTKVARKRNLGLTARQKMAAQILAACIVGGCLLWMKGDGEYSTRLNVPFFKNYTPDLLDPSLLASTAGALFAYLFFFGFLAFMLVGTSNAVNLTDGLDGLASGLMIISAGAMTVLSYVSGHADFARYLEISRTPGASELTIFCGAMTGAALGFLWFNAHPAEVFMGDVGSMALGGGLATVAVLLKQELLLPFIGGVYALEALSVMIQVGSFKLRGKRVFKMAPLHHHFEQIGWDESRVIIRFWILGLILALFALTTLKLR